MHDSSYDPKSRDYFSCKICNLFEYLKFKYYVTEILKFVKTDHHCRTTQMASRCLATLPGFFLRQLINSYGKDGLVRLINVEYSLSALISH